MNQEESSHTGHQTARMKKEHFFKEFPGELNRLFKKYFLIVLVVLTIIVFFSLVASIVLVFTVSSEEYFKFLPPLVLSAASLIAILAYWREHNKTDLENKRSRSEFFLRRASDGLTAVYDLLKDQNNDRVIWIRAARTLLEARKLSEEIELEEYQRAYHIKEQQVRNDLYLALRVYDSKTDSFQPLPPQFFFGGKNWKTDERSLDELAIEASPPMEAYRASINEVLPEPPLGPLSEESVCAIFDFLEYPEDLKDPLKEVKLWSGDWHVFGTRVGAARYIYHRRTSYVVGGELFDRKTENGSSEDEGG